DWSAVPFCSPPPCALAVVARCSCGLTSQRRGDLQPCAPIPSYGIKFRLRMTLPQAHFHNKKKPCVRRGRRRNECPVPFAAADGRPCHEGGKPHYAAN